jgi:hypothetical protein
MAVETRHVRYVFSDVVGFTENRTVEAQVDIVAALNHVFRRAFGDLDTLYLPTGDGICAGILQADAPADVHLETALRVLEFFCDWSDKAQGDRAAQIRVAINESVDAVVTDINGKRNLAGAGINSAQRLMSIADGNQIIAGRAVYDTLRVRDRYVDGFRELKAEIKHGHVIAAYQYVGAEARFLNKEIPFAVQRTDPIDLEMSEEMEKPGGYSTAGMVRAIYGASERWRESVEEITHELMDKSNEKQRAALAVAHAAWEKFYEAEGTFVGALRETTPGTMYRVLGADLDKSLVRGRAKALKNYLEDWSPGAPPEGG